MFTGLIVFWAIFLHCLLVVFVMFHEFRKYGNPCPRKPLPQGLSQTSCCRAPLHNHTARHRVQDVTSQVSQEFVLEELPCATFSFPGAVLCDVYLLWQCCSSGSCLLRVWLETWQPSYKMFFQAERVEVGDGLMESCLCRRCCHRGRPSGSA